MRKLGQLVAAGVVTVAAALAVTATAGASVSHAKAFNGNAHLVHVGLNPASCGMSPGHKSGEVNVHTNAVRSSARVNISVHGALPSTTYVVDIRCVAQIGSLTTNHHGSGTAHIKVSGGLPTTTFFIDLSVPGGGGGAGGYGDTFIAGPFTLGQKR